MSGQGGTTLDRNVRTVEVQTSRLDGIYIPARTVLLSSPDGRGNIHKAYHQRTRALSLGTSDSYQHTMHSLEQQLGVNNKNVVD